MVRVIVIDDEKPARDRLKKLLENYSDIIVVSEAADGATALEQIEEKNPDVVFLDIEMPELNGIEVARTLGVSGPTIVFVTAYDEFALQAFESSAVDYIVKPINSHRFELTIQKIRKTLPGKKNENFEKLFSMLSEPKKPARLAVKVGTKYEVFDPLEISAIIAKDHYSALIVGEKELLSDDSLESVIERLDKNLFLRVHRSAILNTNFLAELKREGDRKYIAVLSDVKRSQIPISRERLVEVKRFLGL